MDDKTLNARLAVVARRRLLDWFCEAGLISERYARMLARCTSHKQPCTCQTLDILEAK